VKLTAHFYLVLSSIRGALPPLPSVPSWLCLVKFSGSFAGLWPAELDGLVATELLAGLSDLMLLSVYQQLARDSLIFCFQVNVGIPSQSRGGQLKLLEDRMCCFEVAAKQDHRLEESVVVKCRLS
jgi:hypothetical protein